MNYACRSEQRFITKKNLSNKMNLSADAKKRREFLRSHNFSINVNPSTNDVEVKVTPK